MDLKFKTANIFFSLFFLIYFNACTFSSEVRREYKSSLTSENSNEKLKKLDSKNPVLLIVIDGFGLETWRRANELGLMTSTNMFFQTGVKGYTQFPSLTFPNISSILEGQPMSNNPISHNQLFADFENDGDRSLRKRYNLETPFGLRKVNKAIQHQLIFSNLSSQNKSSVSLAHSFYEGANASLDLKLDSSFNYLTNHGDQVDELAINSLSEILKSKNVPDFIFLHLVGYDFRAHHYGPFSNQSLQILKRLDQKLNLIYEKLLNLEENHGVQITTLLTGDHGFVSPKNRIHDFKDTAQEEIFKLFNDHHKKDSTSSSVTGVGLRSKFKEQNLDFDSIPPNGFENNIVVLEEGRLLSVNFKMGATLSELFGVSSHFVQKKSVGAVAFRRLNKIWLLNKQNLTSIDYRNSQKNCGDDNFEIAIQTFPWSQVQNLDLLAREKLDVIKLWYCPLESDQIYKYKDYPYFFRQISNYFQSENRSDILMVAEDNFAFSDEEKGFHGGFTPSEVEVPILSRNARLSGAPIFNYQLLQFLFSSSSGLSQF